MNFLCLFGLHKWVYYFHDNYDDVEYINEDEFVVKSFLYSRKCEHCKKTVQMDRKAWWATAGIVPSEKT